MTYLTDFGNGDKSKNYLWCAESTNLAPSDDNYLHSVQIDIYDMFMTTYYFIIKITITINQK